MLGAALPGAWSLCFCKSSHLSRLFVLILIPTCVVPDRVLGQSLTVQEIAGRRSTAVVTITTDNSFGSGVIIDPAGVVVSNLHVVQGALSATVRLSNGDVYDEVMVIGVDERRDLVLLKIQGFGLPAAPLGDSERLRPGDSVVLIGTPEGLAQTVSSGIVSGVRDTGEGYRLIQTNAAASPGSSGGGMFDESGVLVGIVASQFAEGQNLNFAVPINYARGLLPSTGEMALAEMTARYPSDSVSPESISRSSQADNADELASLLENALASSGSTYEPVDDATWVVRYQGGDALDEVLVHVTVYSETALFIASAVEQPELDTDVASQLLGLNYQLDLARLGLDEDGDLQALHQIPIRLLDGNAVSQIANEVATAADQAAAIFYASSVLERSDDLVFSPTSGDIGAIELLDGHVRIRYAPADWEEQDTDVGGGRQFFNESEEIFITTIEERFQIPIEAMYEIVLKNAENAGAEVTEIRRGERNINGERMGFLEWRGVFNGFDMTYLGHFYSDAEGIVQVIGWTSSNIFEDRRGALERLASGIEVLPQ